MTAPRTPAARPAEPAADQPAASPVVGPPRTAFVCRAAADDGPALLTLLRSLALSNPAVCEDFLLLHGGPPGGPGGNPQGGLPADVLAAARRLHPRLHDHPLPGDGGGEGDAEGDGGGPTAGYRSVITLEPGWLVLPGLAVQREPNRAAVERHRLTDDEFRSAYCALPGDKHPDLLLHLAVPLLERRPTVDLARAVGLVHSAQGRYREAVRVLTSVTARADQPRFHETLGSALMAVSRYDEAETHLLLATASPQVAAKAFSRLARLAWLRGDEETSRVRAGLGLDAEPVNRTCRTLHLAAEQAPEADAAAAVAPGEQWAHVALYASGQENAGDKVLPEAVRACLAEQAGGPPDSGRWHAVPVHRLFDDAALEQVNSRRALVVGGGGLFLPDTWPNGNSGWQWNVPDAALRRISVPLAVFAVGYNVFAGQGYERDRFTAALRTLVERSAFFGLRNRGSVARVRDLLPAELRDRVIHQPCPTTVTRHITPGWQDPVRRDDTVLLNCAYDRAALRFGQGYGHFLAELARATRVLRKHTEVRCAAHTPADEQVVHDLRREHGLTLPVEPLYDLSNDSIRDVYRRTRLVIGMRGHAGMIPFGCGTPILSLVSHPKLAYFLADIERPDWGVPVHDPHLGDTLAERAVALLDDHEAAVADVHGRQQLLWDLTRRNLGLLAQAVGTAPAPTGDLPTPRPAATPPADR
ncbi:polysaccharide pyruvyl transferase family protein [Streptomyces sp. 549]|uniref:polysaccharide pyruvyl transferase family protein n=1 Tax=Streptomyces sp. 549 TaxID=3049076 RepID=UPI0024C3A794|nr:polysaccharide pyruvyl transferase family protein [Streptomyces sp. 549]MDK1475975.1 polysaccharide pyruvyl transferase family protein [Streptomyces sp. 549]